MDPRTFRALGSLLVALALVLGAVSAASAQVATLRTPDPDAASTPAPDEEVDAQEALLSFAGCMRDNGIDFPDPQFGVGGAFSADGFGSLDFFSSEFLDAVQACESFLAALQPELDPEEQREQIEQQVLWAQCMRDSGFDIPDPDPNQGFTFGSFRGDDGGLAFDPFSPDFASASTACIAAADIEIPDGAPAG